ncbi:unnamed protein product [Adineta ricciae]|uniref:NAD(P)(+)--arginine ADP-ribosyltransferase n=1 Tax=Adineta ricciae TaxID=249248 RepID=A0A814EUX9_ADIRI|nr:unnamed protein product [Adineta ricciae]CAF0990662.1 unnamed protein product [Adineta ricciae]
MSSVRCLVLWLDSEINNSEENVTTQHKLVDTFRDVKVFDNKDDCQRFIESEPQAHMLVIASGRLGRQLVPAIDALAQIDGVYIYCMDKSRHAEWAKKFPKIKDIFVELEPLMNRIRTDLDELQAKFKSKPSPVSAASATSKPVSSDDKNPCILDGYEKLPLSTLEEAVEPLKDIVGEVEQMVWTAKQNCQNPEDGLTVDESASISVFTMEWFPHESSLSYILNEALRAEEKQKVTPWFLYLRLLFHGLSKLKTISGIVHQGFSGDLTKNYPTNKIYTVWQFSNCSPLIESLEEDEDFGRTGERTLLTIHCRTGKDITRHAFDPSKEQILLSPGCQFKVVSALEADNDLHIVQLQELKPIYSFN